MKTTLCSVPVEELAEDMAGAMPRTDLSGLYFWYFTIPRRSWRGGFVV
jgi:hypothetical protein